MTLSTASLRTAISALDARDGADVAGLTRRDLLELSHVVARVRREADLLLAQVAGEIERRSQPQDGHAGLASREGYRSARELIASATGGSVAEAGRLVAAGELLAATAEPRPGGAGNGATGDGPPPAQSGDVDGMAQGSGHGSAGGGETAGGPLAAVRAELAARARAGRLGLDAVAIFTGVLDTVPNDENAARLIARALDKAEGLPSHRVRALAWRAQALADPAALAEREQRQHQERHVAVVDGADGMVTLTARLTPLDSAAVRAVLDAGVRHALHERRDDLAADPRTPGQMRADILVAALRHALDCDAPTSGVKTTVVVRISHDDLASGMGVGEIDGVPQPVSAGALRNAAADAQVIPAVLSGDSEVLDWGRAKRLFTQAQRLALVERDGGCALCNAPPAWCEAHHIRWWERDAGPTDLSNGVLLCVRCHHRVHRDGWDIEATEQSVWFTPPRSVDPARTPRRGGRARWTVAA